jgi:hypothetical protein
VGELAAVGKFPSLKLMMELHHARERRPRELFNGGARQAGGAIEARFDSSRTLHVRQIASRSGLPQAQFSIRAKNISLSRTTFVRGAVLVCAA